MSGDVEDFGLESSGEGDPVERLRAPLGSTFNGMCWSSRSSLNAGLILLARYCEPLVLVQYKAKTKAKENNFGRG